MKVFKEFWSEMDYYEKKDFIESGIAWAGLFFLGFMMSVVLG